MYDFKRKPPLTTNAVELQKKPKSLLRIQENSHRNRDKLFFQQSVQYVQL